MFIYSLAEKAEYILLGFGLPEAQSAVSGVVRNKFDNHFVDKNIFEPAKFNQRAQREGESIEDFIADLYQLVESCEYGALKNYFLRDSIAVGLRNDKLSQALWLNSDLTLEMTVTRVRQAEKVLIERKVVRSEESSNDEPIEFDAFRQNKFNNKNTRRTNNREASRFNSSNTHSASMRPENGSAAGSKNERTRESSLCNE